MWAGGVGGGSPALHEACQASGIGLARQGAHSCCCRGEIQHDSHDGICQHVDGQPCTCRLGAESLVKEVHVGPTLLTWRLALLPNGSFCEAR